VRIIGPPSAEMDLVQRNALALSGTHPRFVEEMLTPLWDAASDYMIDPVGVVAQAYKETAGGNYTGKVKAEFYNTCGLKIRHLGMLPEADGDQPLAHQIFPSWEVGAEAHVQHLRAYAGWPIDLELVVDPRYQLVVGKNACATFEELSGKWAPSATYGQELVTLARRLRGENV
jgi:N-acetylmuramoyl-L-alanine amidase